METMSLKPNLEMVGRTLGVTERKSDLAAVEL